MHVRVGTAGLLLFGSGFCALVYQTVWLRQLRLVFGSSTMATAAVLAIFLGGLGLGSFVFGRYADRAPQPLRLYGQLELAIASWAALTPLLIQAAGWLYFRLGGSPALGIAGASAVRILLAVLVLAPVTILMGGTLPAATRAVESADDPRRKRFALVYGLNTLGAVAGAFISTFILLETFGNRYSLWLAALLNVLVGLAAITLSRPAAVAEVEGEQGEAAVAPVWFVLLAAGVVGFVFMLMEMVWYRALAPVLGGTTFTFGLILAIALLGIGAGSCVFLLAPALRSSIRTFALTCAAEALFVIVPFAAGDQVAIVAALLRQLSALGFAGMVASWTAIAAFVVLPAAFMAGLQFPVLVSLLGRGQRAVGSHVGMAYASNAAGAVIGAAAAGFGLLPLLTVNGVWRLAAVLLVVLAALSIVLAMRRREPARGIATATLLAILAGALAPAAGPSAVWRHSPIGAGRVQVSAWNQNAIEDFAHWRTRSIAWERDGIESSVALAADDGLALLVNGKSDGHARTDAGTQVMAGMLGALLHPEPRRALVVGLGTGTTAGWLGSVPQIERVDVVEIEPAIIEAARYFKPVNRDVHGNPKVRLIVGDAREVLLAAGGDSYDLIASEPSNPYRAGVASLFTSDFYRNVEGRLRDGGMFLQWVQAYEIDVNTLRTIYATYLQVFPHVTTWQTQSGDLLLVGSRRELMLDAGALRARIAAEPFRSALQNAWRVDDLEGVLAHYVAGSNTATKLAEDARLNTDDRTVIEFGFGRTVGDSSKFDLSQFKVGAMMRNDRMPLVSGAVDPGLVGARRQTMITSIADSPFYEPSMDESLRRRLAAHVAWGEGRYRDVLDAWQGQPRGPSDTAELVTFADALAEFGSEQAVPYINNLRAAHPIEAEILTARLRIRQGRTEEAVQALERAFVAYRKNPWPLQAVMRRGIGLAVTLVREDKTGSYASRMYQLFEAPFSCLMFEELRRKAQFDLARMSDARPCSPLSMKELHRYEPHVPWNEESLSYRAYCYEEKGDPLAATAKRELAAFRTHQPVSLVDVLASR